MGIEAEEVLPDSTMSRATFRSSRAPLFRWRLAIASMIR
jgi:hypothetical protein